MILANVAAAEELEARRQPCMYRVHDAPDPEKVEELRELLDEIGIPGLACRRSGAEAGAVQPGAAPRRGDAGSRSRQRTGPSLPGASRLQPKQYRPFRPGAAALRPFHLADPPLRRPARASGADRRRERCRAGSRCRRTDGDQLAAVAEHISATERRAAAAERAAIERYRATLLAGSIGSVFTGRISGVAEFGLFVTSLENGADGLVPISTLPGDYYERDETAQRLIGRAIRSDLPDRGRSLGPARRSGRDRRPHRLSDRRAGTERSSQRGSDPAARRRPGRRR